MNEITLVTAFFDIGRGEFKNSIWSRSNEQYLNYFKFWAGMDNELVVYTESKFKERILEIREKLGLKEKTKIIINDNIFEMESTIYQRMKLISENRAFCGSRFYPNAVSNGADYDYVMLMKYWCLNDAVQKGYAKEMIAWFDFGFNHGGAYYTNPEDFAFTWKYDFSNKIHLFALSNPDKVNSLEQMQLQCDCIMGCLIVLPEQACSELWTYVKKAMEALLMMDCIDDDQQLLLMAYRERPDLFEIHESDWFMPLKEYGGEHLQTVEKHNADQKGRTSLLDTLRKFKNMNQAGTAFYFAKQMYKTAKKHYK